jgi:hypothetical protein
VPRKLEPLIDPFDPVHAAAAAEWLGSRPPVVKALAAEFPLGTVITDWYGDDWYVIGWNESDCVIISPIWPGGNDYDASMMQRRTAHAHQANP